MSLQIMGEWGGGYKRNSDPETASSDNDSRTYVIDHLNLGAVSNYLDSYSNWILVQLR